MAKTRQVSLTAKQKANLPKAYKQQRRRIEKYIEKKTAEGFIFENPEKLLPKVPKKITEKSVLNLKKRNSTYLLKKATGYRLRMTTNTHDIGDIVTVKEGKKYQKSINRIERDTGSTIEKIEADYQRELYMSESDVVNDTYEDAEEHDWFAYRDASQYSRESLNTDTSLLTRTAIQKYKTDIGYYNDAFSNEMKNWLDELIDIYGEEAVAEMIEKAEEDGVTLEPQIAYSEEQRITYVTKMLNYLPDTATDHRKAIGEALEEDEGESYNLS